MGVIKSNRFESSRCPLSLNRFDIKSMTALRPQIIKKIAHGVIAARNFYKYSAKPETKIIMLSNVSFPDDYSIRIFIYVEFEDIVADTNLDFLQSHCHCHALHLGLHLAEVIFVLVYQHHHLAG